MNTLLIAQLKALSEGIDFPVTVLSNASALLYDSLENLNWAGFYILRDKQLLLGPFQGKPACTVIPVGKGVCGTAAQRDETVLVKDVHQFPGHIACDSASNSEIVVPVHKDGVLYGVLDIDSPLTARFTEDDRETLEAFVKALEQYL